MSKKQKNKSSLLILTRETPEARKERVTSGVAFRATVFADKKRKSLDKILAKEQREY